LENLDQIALFFSLDLHAFSPFGVPSFWNEHLGDHKITKQVLENFFNKRGKKVCKNS